MASPKELKPSAGAGPWRALQIPPLPQLRHGGERLFNLVHQLQPFRFWSLGISLAFFSRDPHLPPPLSLSFTHTYLFRSSSGPSTLSSFSFPGYRASFVFVVSFRATISHFPFSVLSQRHDQINVTIDPSVPPLLLDSFLFVLYRPRSLCGRRAFTSYPAPIIAPPTTGLPRQPITLRHDSPLFLSDPDW